MKLRRATMADAHMLLRWRNDPATRAASHNTDEVSLDGHLRWLAATLENPRRDLWIAEDDGPVGTVRADHSDGVAELSWTVAPERRGHGVGSRMVSLAASQIDGPIRAEVKVGNEASRKIAESAGMTLEREEGGVLYFARHTPPT